MLFGLKKDFEETPRPGVKTTYEMALFGINITFNYDRWADRIEVESALVDVATMEMIKRFPTEYYTSEGKPGPVQNQAAVDAYQAEIITRRDEIKTIIKDIEAKEKDLKKESELNEDGSINPAYSAIVEEIKALRDQLRTKEQALREKQDNPITELRDQIDFVSDVRALVDLNDDTLTAEGKTWIKSFRPGGAKIGDQIDVV